MHDVGLTETQQMIRHTIRDYVTREIEPLVPALEAETLLPYEPIRKMVRTLGLGATGEIAQLIAESPPEEQLKRFVPRILTIEISRVCAGMASALAVTTGLAGANIRRQGTPEQVERWAEPLMRLEKVGSWCLTEPQAGSAALRDMKTTAVRDGDCFVLNGSKTFISNAPYADTFVVYAKLRQNGAESIQGFILERGDAGLTTGPPFKKMGFKASPTGEVFLDDCRIPVDRLLGGNREKRPNVKQSLASERVGLQAISYGIMERAFEIALKYARERQQGGRVIGDYQLIQRRLTRMYVALANARAFVFGDLQGRGDRAFSPADASAGKLYVAEMATFMAIEAMHILGGNGYMEEYVVERLVRDAKLIELAGGTTEMQELTTGKWLMANYEV